MCLMYSNDLPDLYWQQQDIRGHVHEKNLAWGHELAMAHMAEQLMKDQAWKGFLCTLCTKISLAHIQAICWRWED